MKEEKERWRRMDTGGGLTLEEDEKQRREEQQQRGTSMYVSLCVYKIQTNTSASAPDMMAQFACGYADFFRDSMYIDNGG